MEIREYSAGGVKYSFWFMEFRKMILLLVAWKTIEEIESRWKYICCPNWNESYPDINTVSVRASMLYTSFSQIFVYSVVSIQKLFNLVDVMAYDTLFAEFVYKVIREKMTIGSNEFADSDIRVFFKNN